MHSCIKLSKLKELKEDEKNTATTLLLLFLYFYTALSFVVMSISLPSPAARTRVMHVDASLLLRLRRATVAVAVPIGPPHLLHGHGADVGRGPGDGAHRRRHPRGAARRVGGPATTSPATERAPGALRDLEPLVHAARRRRADAELVAEPGPAVQVCHPRRRRRQQLVVPPVEGLRAPQRVLAQHEAPRQHRAHHVLRLPHRRPGRRRPRRRADDPGL